MSVSGSLFGTSAAATSSASSAITDLQLASSTSATSGPLSLPPSSRVSGAASAAPPLPTSEVSASEDPLFASLQKASRLVDAQLTQDARYPYLEETLSTSASDNYQLPHNQLWSPFETYRTCPIPEELFRFAESSAHANLGIFPEIDRAWLTVNHALYLWDYNGGDICSFEELDQAIVSVGLVPPKKGVFVDEIKHVLVICTPSQVMLLGLAWKTAESSVPQGPGTPRQQRPEVVIYVLDIAVATDGVHMKQVTGFANGRIFLSGNDSCLYELTYQGSEGWFTRKASLHNHSASGLLHLMPNAVVGMWKKTSDEVIEVLAADSARNVLYALTSRSSIEVYYLGPKGDQLTMVAKAVNVRRKAHTLWPAGGAHMDSKTFKIVSICPISPAESKDVHLVAFTSTGVRLYFFHSGRGGPFSPSSEPLRPDRLELKHVRAPPAKSWAGPQSSTGASATYPGRQPPILYTNITKALYSETLTLGLECLAQDENPLWCAAPNVATLAKEAAMNRKTTIDEWTVALPLEGRLWAVAEVPRSDSLLQAVAAEGGTRLNELAMQLSLPPRQFLVFTDMCMAIVTRQRPIDTLLRLLETLGGNDTEVEGFAHMYGFDQFCAMCLGIAAGNSMLMAREVPPNSNGFSLATIGEALKTARMTSPEVQAIAKRLFFEVGYKPSLIGGQVQVPLGGHTVNVSPSGRQVALGSRHSGLAMYLARLLRPIWNRSITELAPTRGQTPPKDTGLPVELLLAIQQDLASLKTFLDNSLFLLAPVSEYHSASENAEAVKEEQKSILAMRDLLSQSLEAISFVLLLVDNNLSNIMSACSTEDRKAFTELKFRDLLSKRRGRELAKVLLSALINQQIAQQISVDTISQVLQDRCGSFCSAEDVLLYKAAENIRRAKETKDIDERSQCLHESVRLFKKAAKNLPVDKLKEVCQEYKEMRYPLGAIEVALECANQWDPRNEGLSYYLAGSSTSDPRWLAYENRLVCYKCVTGVLEAMDDLVDQLIKQGKDATPSGRVELDEIDSLRRNAFKVALLSQDQLFHFTLYQWLIDRGLSERLLEIRTPHVEAFLMQEPFTLEKVDLLWQYRVRNGEPVKAVPVLASLAESTEFGLSLNQRVEYLSLAVSNAKSHGSASTQYPKDAVEFLAEVEEKLEVAQVQVEVWRTLDEMPVEGLGAEADKRSLMERLNDKLYNVTELYTEYAEPYEMLHVKLMIFHVSDHRNFDLVMSTWLDIIERASKSAEEGKEHEAVAMAVIELGRRFFPSDIAFPVDMLTDMLEKFTWRRFDEELHDIPEGWAPRTLVEAGVPAEMVFNVLHGIYEAKLPPFQNTMAAVFLLADIAALLQMWLESFKASRGSYRSSVFGYNDDAADRRARTDPFPAGRIDEAITHYTHYLHNARAPDDTTKAKIENTLSRLGALAAEMHRIF